MVASFGLHSDSQLDLEHEATCQSIESETVNYDPLVERNEDIATEPNLDVDVGENFVLDFVCVLFM